MHHFCLALPRIGQGQAEPILSDRVIDVLQNKGFEGAKTWFLYAPFEGYARSAAEHVDTIDNAATIDRGLSIIMQRWYDKEINSGNVDMERFINFMYNTSSVERQANNTSRLLV